MINSSTLVGRLTRDPDLRYTREGTPVVSFTLAVNRSFTNANGEREADFINCIAWRGLAENISKFLGKGSLVGVEGRIQTRNYEGQDGRRVFVTEVVVRDVAFLDSRKGNGVRTPSDEDAPPQRGTNSAPQERRMNDDPFADASSIDIQDDDFPF